MVLTYLRLPLRDNDGFCVVRCLRIYVVYKIITKLPIFKVISKTGTMYIKYVLSQRTFGIEVGKYRMLLNKSILNMDKKFAFQQAVVWVHNERSTLSTHPF